MKLEPVPVEQYLADYLEVAKRVGHTPKCYELPRRVLAGLHRHGMNITKAALACGLIPNQNKHPPHPLPESFGIATPEQAKKPVPATTPPPPWALTSEELAAEREEHLARMRKKYAAMSRTARPRRRFRDFTTAPSALRVPPDYLPPDYAVDVWRLTRRDAA